MMAAIAIKQARPCKKQYIKKNLLHTTLPTALLELISPYLSLHEQRAVESLCKTFRKLKCPHTRELILPMKISVQNLTFISNKYPNLTTLILNVHTKELLPEISKCMCLRELALFGNEIVNDESFSLLGRMEHLESLDLAWCNITDKSIATLNRFPKLTTLSFEATSVTAAAIKSLKKLVTLKKLNVSSFWYNKVKKRIFSELPQLEELSICTVVSSNPFRHRGKRLLAPTTKNPNHSTL